MPVQSLKHKFAFAAALFAGLAFQTVGASAEGPFASLAGSWAGSGTISMNSGTHERIRCRGTYDVSQGGDTLTQSLLCASDSYKFDVQSTVSEQGGAISGNWTETTRNASGTVSGQIRGPVIQVLVTGVGFTAGISIATRGRTQSVAIRPSGGTDVAGVIVTLHRI
ncbi:MAG TPA: hypothetical protein VKV77_14350 [Methylovirgula sp.]|nr:hypothetical protein [Methylovirgula sp.]